MKKFVAISALACLAISAYMADGTMLYKKCAVYHGSKADKVYLDKVPALKSISIVEKLQYMEEYSEGKGNVYGQGAITKINFKGSTEENFKALEVYIETL